MIRDITLGQYYRGESSIHRIDPRLKIVMTVVYMVSLFVIDNFVGFAVAFVFMSLVIALSKVPVRFILRGLKPIFLIIIFTFILNLFMYDGTIIFKIGFLKVTKEGLYVAVFMAIRLIFLIIGSSMLTLTTRPISLTDGIERLLSPLNRIGVPSHELAMMMTIALRFIPTLLEETDKIMKAQQARGADFETGNILNRAKNLIPVLVPLFISAFHIAQDMAMAMEARCYRGGEGRTRMNQMKMGRIDIITGVLFILYMTIIIMMRVIL